MSGDLEARLARVEAELQIRALASGYAIALDTRDMARLASLYAPDMPHDPADAPGGAGEAARIEPVLTGFYRTFHFVGTHLIEFDTPTSATGFAYGFAQHEVVDKWYEMAICYRDSYKLHEGRWLFARRRQLDVLYYADMNRGPGGAGPYNRVPPWTDRVDPRVVWPKSMPSWDKWWDERPDLRDQRTAFP